MLARVEAVFSCDTNRKAALIYSELKISINCSPTDRHIDRFMFYTVTTYYISPAGMSIRNDTYIIWFSTCIIPYGLSN